MNAQELNQIITPLFRSATNFHSNNTESNSLLHESQVESMNEKLDFANAKILYLQILLLNKQPLIDLDFYKALHIANVSLDYTKKIKEMQNEIDEMKKEYYKGKSLLY